jgi:type VI secretion system protein ImpK
MHSNFSTLAPALASPQSPSVRRLRAESCKNDGRYKCAVPSLSVVPGLVAFCATVDEIILKSQFKVRDSWELRPLQLTMFGEQLAGETFFIKLEELRAKGAKHVQALEVYHMCLLLGFQGKYMMEGTEKLKYLTARLGDEISNMKGKRAPFAPHWNRPDKVSHQLKTETPLWVITSVFALLGLVAYLGLSSWSTKSTKGLLGGYEDIVKLAPRAANITITLP